MIIQITYLVKHALTRLVLPYRPTSQYATSYMPLNSDIFLQTSESSHIVRAVKHPHADSLYIYLQVRRRVVVVANLKPC